MSWIRKKRWAPEDFWILAGLIFLFGLGISGLGINPPKPTEDPQLMAADKLKWQIFGRKMAIFGRVAYITTYVNHPMNSIFFFGSNMALF